MRVHIYVCTIYVSMYLRVQVSTIMYSNMYITSDPSVVSRLCWTLRNLASPKAAPPRSPIPRGVTCHRCIT